MLLAGTAVTEAVKGYGRKLYVLVYSILEKGLRSGEFISSLQLEALARHFVMAIQGVRYEWCVRYLDFDVIFFFNVILLYEGEFLLKFNSHSLFNTHASS